MPAQKRLLRQTKSDSLRHRRIRQQHELICQQGARTMTHFLNQTVSLRPVVRLAVRRLALVVQAERHLDLGIHHGARLDPLGPELLRQVLKK